MKQQYDSYKDSGVEWIGRVPSHWKIQTIKTLLIPGKDGIKIGPFGSALTGNVGTNLPYKLYGQWNVSSHDFNAGLNTVSEETYNSLSSYWVRSGDILISMMGTIGKCSIIPENIQSGLMDSHIVKIRLNNKLIDSHYFEYVYDKDNSNIIFTELKKVKSGSIMDGLNSSIIKRLHFIVPPLVEQEAIAVWLDEKCGEIDKVIEGEKRRISLLEELKQSVITEAVTHGLNPDAPLKPSGVDWIGRVPIHWDICRVKDCFTLKTGTTPKGFDKPIKDNMINWFTPSDITSSVTVLHEAERKLSENLINKEGISIFPPKSLIFVGIGATAGKLGYAEVAGYSNQQITGLIPKSCCSKFYFYYLCQDSKRIRDNASFTTLPIINNSYLSQIYWVRPPLVEQQAIVDYLDAKCGAIDADIAKTKRKIELLQEYKQSLITEAVTGKRKVL